ncbi:porin [Thalassotalea euphylliae]|uniref:Porin n=1 Tax=Thalassotalea euphylliae TaxID=1655234 RepID=A0A3E0UL52_9GAMM|nr:porin [Thalassotalea euphylliae]REL36462.1 porin [Thalassotalea euphylliae]
MMKKRYLTTVIAALMCSPHALAQIEFNGFGSVRASYSDSDEGAPPFTYLDEGEVTFKGESLFALQARGELGEGLSATIQLFAEGREDFDVEARWAYLSYQINDIHQVHIGKLANPIFHQSEYEKVGYAHNFSRLPTAVYSNFEFATMEGISLNSQFSLADGDYTLDTKLSFGNWDGGLFLSAIGGEVPLALDQIISLNLTLSSDWWKVFAGVFGAEIQAEQFDQAVVLASVQPGIDLALAQGATTSDVNNFINGLGWHEKDGLYWFSGFGIDYNNILLDAEYVSYGVEESSDSTNEGWYVALGYRFNEFVITVHAEEQTQEIDYSEGLSGVQSPTLLATGQTFIEVLGQPEFDAVGITLRYDFHPNAAFKVDYISGDHTRPDIGDYSIMSAGIDVVF